MKNRILSAPVGASCFSPSSHMTDYVIEFFEQRARGGAATVTMGDTPVAPLDPNPDPRMYPKFNLHEREGFAVLCEFADTMRQHGALASIQFNHSGPDFGIVKSVDIFGNTIRALTEEEILQVVQHYIECAKTVKRAGFQMLQLHCGHSWFMNQCLRYTNTRDDKWGGSFENRLRFPLAVINGVREAVGEEFIIEIRISGMLPDKLPDEFEEMIAFLRAIEDKIDIINVSSGGHGFPKDAFGHPFPSALDPMCLNLEKTAAIRARVNTPVACLGNILFPSQAEQIIAEGKADFVEMGRALIADPEWPNKARRRAEDEIRPCLGCYKCLDIMHKRDILTCDINPVIGHEHRVKGTSPAGKPRKVVIVGGGPAGMTAAVTAHDRGHNVVLFEKESQLGGLLRMGDHTPLKLRMKNYRDFLVKTVEKRGIDVRLNIAATKQTVESERPDVVIAATGSASRITDIPGVRGENVVTAVDINMGKAAAGKRVVILGGNMSGCETAIALLDKGHEVSIVTGGLHRDLNIMVSGAYDERLKGANIIRDSRCTEISADGVAVRGFDGGKSFVPADTVVLALGSESNDALSKDIMCIADDFAEIGDCLKPATIREAVHSGYYTAMDL